MKSIFAIVLVWTVMFISGCSDQDAQSDAYREDHVLRGKMDMMHEAGSMTNSANEKIREQNREADMLAGH